LSLDNGSFPSLGASSFKGRTFPSELIALTSLSSQKSVRFSGSAVSCVCMRESLGGVQHPKGIVLGVLCLFLNKEGRLLSLPCAVSRALSHARTKIKTLKKT
jgi:hypothetical protein